MDELDPRFRFHVDEPPKLAAAHPVDGRLADADGTVPKNRMQWSRAKSLVSMQGRFAFFSPAILYLYGGFRDQMLEDFAARHSSLEVWWGFTLFDRPLFAGLESPDGDREWNHALWCVPAETYKVLRPYLASIALSYEPKKWLAETGVQELRIVDPIAPWRTILVDSFGLKATDGLYYLDDETSSLPRFRIGPPTRDAEIYRNAVLNGDNPLLELELEELARARKEHP